MSVDWCRQHDCIPSLEGLMKKLVVVLCFVLLAASLLPTAGAAAPAPRALQPLQSAPEAPVNGVRYRLPAGLRLALQARGANVAASHPGAPIERVSAAARGSSGPCTVDGTLLDYDGVPVSGAQVDLWYRDAQGAYHFFDWTTTGGSGTFVFTGAPETTDAGLYVSREDGDGYQSWNNSLVAGVNPIVIQPGRAYAEVARTSDEAWNGWDWVRVETYGSGGGGTTWLNGESGGVWAAPPDCDYAVAYPWDNQGIEWWAPSPLTIGAGTTNSSIIIFNQDDGRSVFIDAPYWASGKAGTVATMVLENWPAGFQASFYGYSEGPVAAYKEYAAVAVSDGAKYGTIGLGVPGSAPPGYTYEIHAWRHDTDDSGLDLATYFQVASLKPSRTAIRRGGAVRLTGVVPTEGHMGSTPGKSKYVVVYERARSAGQPTRWDATRNGWTKVATVRTDGYGRYASRLLHPTRTIRYVVRYPGDAWYWGAYTSVVKVAVR
jgi:hypothetical protein